MVEVSVFHNGSTNVAQKTVGEGWVVPDASVAEVHEDKKQVVKDQIRHGILAEEAGFDRVFFTEHHFQPTGSEFSTNPLMSQMVVANETEEIKLAQAANILSWHDPVRFAEQTSILDIVSDGRVEVGIGRGYQPRENEVLGQYWGGTIQDQEENRVSFQEKLEIIREAWTQDWVSFHGEYHQVPPAKTTWHHRQDHAYLESLPGEKASEVIDWKEGDIYSSGGFSPVLAGGSRLKKLAVFPQPVQEPHPQLWQPLTSFRSVRFAAENSVNGVFNLAPLDTMKKSTDEYYRAAEEAGWPDHRPEYDGEPFDYGWDEERGRGVVLQRYVFNDEIAGEETLERYKRGIQNAWDFYAQFGFGTLYGKEPDARVTTEELVDQRVIIVGDAEHIANELIEQKEELEFEGLHVNAWFEVPGVSGETADEQLEAFGERVIPRLEEAV